MILKNARRIPWLSAWERARTGDEGAKMQLAPLLLSTTTSLLPALLPALPPCIL